MLGMNPGPAAIELPSATYRQVRDIGGFTHCSRFADPLSRRRVDVGPGVVCVSPRIPQVCR
jgi:hypothetical protein